mgnify:CR=1 FL=1
MILAFFTPIVGEAAWCALPDEVDQPPRNATGVIPGGGGIAAVAGFLACHCRVYGVDPPRAIVIAPDDGSGAEFVRWWFHHHRTTIVPVALAEAYDALKEFERSGCRLWAKLRADSARERVLFAAALAWREQRRHATRRSA